MSVDFFRVSARELKHPTAGGISPSLIWGYRIANVLLNGLNAFWWVAVHQLPAHKLCEQDAMFSTSGWSTRKCWLPCRRVYKMASGAAKLLLKRKPSVTAAGSRKEQ
jgi:hypothetical protein